MSRMRETDVAGRVIAYLQDLKYEVHQEAGGADIVALMSGYPWIIECKVQLGLDVLAQAWNWVRLGAAAFVSVATPIFRQSDGCRVAEHFMREQGVGWLSVGEWGPDGVTWHGDYPVTEHIQPRVQATFRRRDRRYVNYDIRRACNDKTLNGYAVAGSPSPRRWTPFKETCDEVRRALKNGPMTTRQLVDTIQHHYASAGGARSRLAHYLGRGIIEGIGPVPETRPQQWRLKP